MVRGIDPVILEKLSSPVINGLFYAARITLPNQQKYVFAEKAIPGPCKTNLILNGGFDSGVNWSVLGQTTINGGKANIVCQPDSYEGIIQNVPLVEGHAYRIIFTVSDFVSGSAYVEQYNNDTPGYHLVGGWPNANGVYSYTFIALPGAYSVGVRSTLSSQFSVDNVTLVDLESLVVNGGFDTADNWTFWDADGGNVDGLSISGGKCNCVGNTANATLNQMYILTPLRTYRVTYKVSNYVRGAVTPILWSVSANYARGTARSVDGEFTEILTCPADNTIGMLFFEFSTNSSMSIDDIVLEECSLSTLKSVSDIPQEGSNNSNNVTLSFANVDGFFTSLERTQSFLGSKVEIFEYLEELDLAYLKWSGWADDFEEISDIEATLKVFGGYSTLKSEAPRRTISPNCPWNFGEKNYPQGANTLIEFEGCECPYQKTATVGFKTQIADSIDGTTDLITFGVSALPDGQLFGVDDEIIIDNEVMRVYNVISATAITVLRGMRGTDMAPHTAGATIKFYDCHYTVAACKRRGMFGNNASDTYSVNSVTYRRNYFGGFPALSQVGRWRLRITGPMQFYREKFAGNDSAYGKELPLVYGRCLLSEPILLFSKPDGQGPDDNKFVSYVFAVCEGTLACNNTNGDQDLMGAYDLAKDGKEFLYVNGVRRHDPRPNYGIWGANGYSEQRPPDIKGVAEFTTNHLGFIGTTILQLRILEDNNSSGEDSVDAQNNASGSFGIRYGRLVRVYNTESAYTWRAAQNPGDVLLDFETSRRSAGGQAYSRFNIQSFIDLNTYCAQTVTSVVDGSSVKRWTFNGSITGKKSVEEHERNICLGMYCLPPMMGSDGKYYVKALKSESLDNLPIFTTISGTSRNILVEDGGIPSLKKKRKSLIEIPNEIKVNFMCYDSTDKEWIKTQLILSDRELQRQTGKVTGDGSLRVVSKTVDLLGVTTVDEAARIGTLILRAGEFAEGGAANNLVVEFDTLYKDSANVSRGDIIKVEDSKLDSVNELYYRVISIEDSPVNMDGGGILFKRHIVATLHHNSIYDDTAYTCTAVTRLDAVGNYGAEAPAVSDLVITEKGFIDKSGNRQALLTFSYVEPGEHAGTVYSEGTYTPGSLQVSVNGVSTSNLEVKAEDYLRIGSKDYPIATDVVFSGGLAVVTLKVGLQDSLAPNAAVKIISLRERGSFKDVVIQRSTTDGNGNPVGDWRFVAELSKSGIEVSYNVTNGIECFTALSRNKARGVPSPETKLSDGNYKYPRTTILVDGVTDNGNPSGASDLTIITAEDDPTIPRYHAAFQMNAETVNTDGIMGVAVVLSPAAVAMGPYLDERTVHGGSTYIEYSMCTVVAGRTRINIPGRASNPEIVGRVMCIFTFDGTPDSDLDGTYVKAQGPGYIEVDRPFNKYGAFTYFVMKRWMDIGTEETTNTFYYWFPFEEISGSKSGVWRTSPVELPQGTHYVTAYSRNPFGVGTRLTAGPITITWEGQVTTDTDNPSGCSGLEILDYTSNLCGKDEMLFRFNRDLQNWKTIFNAMVVLKQHTVWVKSNAYSVGDVICNTGIVGGAYVGPYNNYICITAGTSGSSEPSWNTTIGATTGDGGAVWRRIHTVPAKGPYAYQRNYWLSTVLATGSGVSVQSGSVNITLNMGSPPADHTYDDKVLLLFSSELVNSLRIPSHVYNVGEKIVSPNNYIQEVTTPGTAGAGEPLTWNATLNGTTNDGGVVWTNRGSADLSLDGNIIESQLGNNITIFPTRRFVRTGTMQWAIVEEWWSSANAWCKGFEVPAEIRGGDLASKVWSTANVNKFGDSYISAEVYTRNIFGVSHS